MDLLTSIASFGLVPAIFTTGRLLLINLLGSEVENTSTITRIGMSATLGLGVWLIAMYGLAFAGILSPPLLGSFAWIVSGLAYLKIKRQGLPMLWNRSDLIIACFALALFAWNAAYASESLLGGRDQGTYSLHGASIAKSGSLKVDFFNEILLDYNHRTLLHQARAVGFGYNLDTNVLEAQFPPAVSLILAQFYGIGGYAALLCFVPFLASINVLIIFEFAKRISNAFWAIWASVFFAINPAQLWNSRITLSEIPAQSFILLGLLLATIGIKKNRNFTLLSGITILVYSCFTRIDSYLFFIIIPVFLFLLHSYRPKQISILDKPAAWAVSGILVITYGVSYLYYASTNHYYLRDMASQVQLIGLAGFVVWACTLLLILKFNKQPLSDLLPGRPIIYIFAGTITSLLLYCIFIRPHIEPFSQFTNSHYGTRDYRENSINDLSAYISHIVIILGAAGSILASWRILKKRELHLLPLVATWLVFSIIYLQDPRISPDHIWRIRRFTPIIIPGFILLCAYFGYWVETKSKKQGPILLGKSIIGLSSMFFLTWSIQPIASLKQYEGTISMIESVGAAIEKNALVVTDISSRYFAPLAIAENKQIVRVDFTNPNSFRAVQVIAESEIKKNTPVYLLSHRARLSPSARSESLNWRFDIPKLKKTNTAPARELEREIFSLNLEKLNSKLFAFSGNEKQINIGNVAYLGVPESGMLGSAINGESLRWTTNLAKFEVPLIFERPFESGTLNIAAASPEGTPLTLQINGQIVLETFVLQAGGQFDFSLENVLSEDTQNAVIELSCETWIPAELEPGSTDTRELGVRLAGISLNTGLRETYGNLKFGIEPLSGIFEEGLHPAEYHSDKPRRWTNGHALFNIQVQPGFQPNNLSIKIHDRLIPNTPFKIIWNGEPIWESQLENHSTEISIPIDPQNSNTENIIELVSDAATPQSLGTNNDTRTLGIMIEELELSGFYLDTKN